MSLFSRLDRVRDKAKADAEDGVFAVPDLGTRDTPQTPVQPVAPAAINPSPEPVADGATAPPAPVAETEIAAEVGQT
ncbi:MAG: hypothetical protein KY445_02195, partial [Armatimonadetes bacterium]|nr:hypothetical protein [Armatimonadota bacterium]